MEMFANKAAKNMARDLKFVCFVLSDTLDSILGKDITPDIKKVIDDSSLYIKFILEALDKEEQQEIFKENEDALKFIQSFGSFRTLIK